MLGKKGKGVTTKRHHALVRELRRLLSFEGSSFSRHGPPAEDDEKLPTSEKEVNAFIDARTRLWRSTWVLPLLDELEGKRTVDEVLDDTRKTTTKKRTRR